jgi:ABC-2 type transport system ATP-binding protein
VVVALVAVVVLLRGSSARVPVVIAIVAAYAVVALATGGSKAVEAPSPGERPGEGEYDAGIGGDEQREALGTLTAGRPATGSTGDPALVVEHLTKRFGERLAVDDVSFSVGAGEVFGFLGPNGAGKTTTVRILASLIAPTSGRARVAGVPLEAANGVEVRKRIAVMTESPGLYLRLTVVENLAFFAGLYELAEPEKRIGQALAAVNLTGRAGDPCGSLSKGLRQRVALARALLSNPAVVFLDEPTSGLDPVASRDVHELIDGLRERGVTVFLTTHRLDEAERLCDRVAILNTRLRTIGRPDELRDRFFTKTLLVRTAAPLASPETVFAAAGVDGWRARDTTRYELTVSDASVAAPAVTRALVAADADLLSLGEAQHSLEDVYLELIADDPEAAR